MATGEVGDRQRIAVPAIAEHRDEIDALQFFYSVPHKKRLRFKDIQVLAKGMCNCSRSPVGMRHSDTQ